MPKYNQRQFEKDLKELEKMMNKNHHHNNHHGGKNDSNERHFKVVELDGQVVDFGRISIRKVTKGGKPGPGPIAAAKKALRSICEHLGMSGDKKLKVNVKFMIKEITQDSDKKIYGPYRGHYKKYSEKEMKEKKKATGRTYEMEPVVKMIHSKNHNKKNNHSKNNHNKKNHSKNNHSKNNQKLSGGG